MSSLRNKYQVECQGRKAFPVSLGKRRDRWLELRGRKYNYPAVVVSSSAGTHLLMFGTASASAAASGGSGPSS